MLASMRILPSILVALALGAPWGAAYAQAPLPPLDEFQVRRFLTQDGLPVRWTGGFAVSPQGELLVATGDGLFRFDGRHFTSEGLEPFEGLYLVQDLLVDGDARVWVRTRDHRLGFVRDRRAVEVDLLREGEEVYTFTDAGTAGAWIATSAGLLLVGPGSDPEVHAFGPDDGVPGGAAIGVFTLPDGERIAVGTSGMSRVDGDLSDPTTIRFHPVGPDFTLDYARREAVLVDAAGLRVFTPTAVITWSDGRATVTPSAEDAPALSVESIRWPIGGSGSMGIPGTDHLRVPVVTSPDGSTLDRASHAIRTRAGDMWFVMTSSSDGRETSHLVRWSDGVGRAMPLADWSPADHINGLVEDHEGSLWVATDQGVLQLVHRRVRSLGTEGGIAHPFVTAVRQTRTGDLWVGTWGGGLQRYRDGAATGFTRESGLPSNEVRAIFETAAGDVWVGTSAGAARIEGDRAVATIDFDGAARIRPAHEIRGFTESDDGTLWMAGMSGVRRWTGDRWERAFVEALGREDVWAIHDAGAAGLWVGTRDGLFRIDGPEVRSFTPDDGLASTFVVSISEETDGTLWFGTYRGGLHRWRDGGFARVSTDEGLHHDGVWTVVEDGAGGLWMSSDQGVFRVDRDELHAVADGVPGARVHPIVLREAEGMPSREANRASPAGWRLDDGRLVFNSQAGLSVIDPVLVRTSTAPPIAVVDRVLADGEPLPRPGSGGVPVPAGTRHIGFDFFALTYRAPSRTTYRYRLDGYDVEWSVAAPDTRASYTNLPPGDYVFRVQATNTAGVWGDADTSLEFEILPFPWQRTSVRILAALLMMGALTFGYRYHIARVRQVERIRMRIAADLHDDVGSSLSSISLLSELLRREVDPSGPAGARVERIHAAASDTMVALREVIWLVDPSNGNTTQLVDRLGALADDLLPEIEHDVRVESLEHRPLAMTFVRNVVLIFKEALHNAARHSGARRVSIRIAEDRGAFHMEVADDGGGFDPDTVARGYGLESMQRRAREAGGDLTVSTGPNGTRVTFRCVHV